MGFPVPGPGETLNTNPTPEASLGIQEKTVLGEMGGPGKVKRWGKEPSPQRDCRVWR